ncbi:MAG TPA: CapA family protein [Candidatus Paceibacterota bacterium]|nr:CapA family protein [Candidatus Paceibacterota bacterium]
MTRFLLIGAATFAGSFLATVLAIVALAHLEFARIEVADFSVPVATAEGNRDGSVRVLFVGDLMFDRYIRTAMARDGGDAVLAGVREFLQDADLTVGNLEGPITPHASVSQGSNVGDPTNMRFTFDPSVAGLLARHGFDLVSLGNNHIRDFGTAGVVTSRDALDAAGIAYVGDPTGMTPEPSIRTVGGMRIAFVAYSDFVAGDADRATLAIETAERIADATVLVAHWGDEYEVEPPQRVRELARRFVASGADLVIGTHSHVIGASERISGVPVYYSLGNFVFDQYFSSDVRCGLAVTATFLQGGDRVRIETEGTRIGMREDGHTALGCS